MSFNRISFKNFILRENIELLGNKIGYIYSASTDLQSNYKDLGPKMTSKQLQKIASDIQALIQGHLATENKKQIETLRDLGVAIMKELDPQYSEKLGVEQLLNLVVEGLKSISEKLGVPINDLGVEPGDEGSIPTNKDNTTKPKDMEINTAAQPVSGFDSSAAPALGTPPEQQNPNVI
jgi:hypothetical protein